MDFSSVKTTEELVKFNEEHRDLEMPSGCYFSFLVLVSNALTEGLESSNQDVLEGSLKADPWTEDQNAKRLAEGVAHAGANGIDKALAENDIDVILGPADSWLTDFACVAGPFATVYSKPQAWH